MSKGTVTDYIDFIVQEVSKDTPITYEGTRRYEDCRWFKRKEGEKKGLQFIIPITHPEYSNEMEEKLHRLSKSDTVSLKLESMNERNTVWICKDVKLST